MIELEKELLSSVEINKFNIRNEIEGRYDEPSEGDYPLVEDEVNDKFNPYVALAELFGEKVFEYDRGAKTIKLAPDFKAQAEYLLCIACMAKEDTSEISEDMREKMSDFFEELVAEAVKKYLGKNAKSKLIDGNSEDRNGMAIKKVFTDELKEKHHPNILQNYKEGLPRSDIIAWKPIDDRYGKIILIIQCKSGKNWRKGLPVNMKVWKTNIGDFSADPIKAFAIADLLIEDEDVDRYSKEKGLIFDRLRIVKLLANTKNDELAEIRQKIDNLNLRNRF